MYNIHTVSVPQKDFGPTLLTVTRIKIIGFE